jgi:hypothetical protein
LQNAIDRATTGIQTDYLDELTAFYDRHEYTNGVTA